jgi:hypothetical protein
MLDGNRVIALLLCAGCLALTVAAQVPTYKPTQTAGTVPVEACPAKLAIHPDVDGVYAVGGDIKAPKLKKYVPPQLSTEAKTRSAFNPFQPDPARVSLVVDTQGMPQDLCIMKAVGYGLDAEAARAVWQYRFEPAHKADGSPVPVRISVQVGFDTHPH